MENSRLLKVTEVGNKTAAKPEARTSCPKNRDMPAESAVGWPGQSYLCHLPGTLTFIRLDMRSKLGSEPVIKKKSPPPGKQIGSERLIGYGINLPSSHRPPANLEPTL